MPQNRQNVSVTLKYSDQIGRNYIVNNSTAD